MTSKKNLMIAALGSFAFAGTSHADLLTISDVFAHNESTNFAGIITDQINGSGMDGNPETGGPYANNDPSTWTTTLNNYQSEWQSQDLLAPKDPPEDLDADGVLVGANVHPGTNGKIGWAIYDLGATYALDDLFIWHIRETSARVATNFNVLVASSPTAAPVHGPTNSSSRDYNFASGGWTTVATGLSGTFRGNQVVDLSGNSGRFVAIEIITNGGDLNRVGFAEIAITSGGPLFDPADLDQDGDVDDADFGIAFAAFTGPNAGPSNNPAADLDQDNDVDDADFGIAFAFTGPGGGAGVVPEPTSLALLGLGGLMIARRRRA